MKFFLKVLLFFFFLWCAYSAMIASPEQTVFSQDEREMLLREFGNIGLIQKPVDPELLKQMIEETFEKLMVQEKQDKRYFKKRYLLLLALLLYGGAVVKVLCDRQNTHRVELEGVKEVANKAFDDDRGRVAALERVIAENRRRADEDRNVVRAVADGLRELRGVVGEQGVAGGGLQLGLGDLGRRFDVLIELWNDRVDPLESKVGGIESKVGGIESKVDLITNHNLRIKKLESVLLKSQSAQNSQQGSPAKSLEEGSATRDQSAARDDEPRTPPQNNLRPVPARPPFGTVSQQEELLVLEAVEVSGAPLAQSGAGGGAASSSPQSSSP